MDVVYQRNLMIKMLERRHIFIFEPVCYSFNLT